MFYDITFNDALVPVSLTYHLSREKSVLNLDHILMHYAECHEVFMVIYHFTAYAFAELVDNCLAATRNNTGHRNIEIRLVGANCPAW